MRNTKTKPKRVTARDYRARGEFAMSILPAHAWDHSVMRGYFDARCEAAVSLEELASARRTLRIEKARAVQQLMDGCTRVDMQDAYEAEDALRRACNAHHVNKGHERSALMAAYAYAIHYVRNNIN